MFRKEFIDFIFIQILEIIELVSSFIVDILDIFLDLKSSLNLAINLQNVLLLWLQITFHLFEVHTVIQSYVWVTLMYLASSCLCKNCSHYSCSYCHSIAHFCFEWFLTCPCRCRLESAFLILSALSIFEE